MCTKGVAVIKQEVRECPSLSLFGNIAQLWGSHITDITSVFLLPGIHIIVGYTYFEEAPRSEIGGLEFLECTGNETNLLECLRVDPNEFKRQSLCSSVAGVSCSGR